MSRRKTKIAGTAASKDARPPVCSTHLTSEHMRRDLDDKWFCAECADEFLRADLRARRRETETGIILPIGVEDPRYETASFRDVYPNRRARRAAKKMKAVST